MCRTIGWASAMLLAAALSACGGGGDSGAAPTALTTATKKLRTGHTAAVSGHSEDQSQLATKAGNGADPALRPLAASRFSRANAYHVYAANGSKKLLRLDFDSRQYEMLDSVGQSTSGGFSEDASEPGTYVFASSRIESTTNTARFRVTQGAIVGAFPFEKPWSSPTVYPVVPFVAASNFVGNAAELDGEYNRLGISLSSNGTTDSQILPLRISGGGTVLEMCFDNVIYRMELCPTGSKRTYTIAPSADSVWTATSASPNDFLQFRMARINGQNVWLSGGWTDAAPNTHVFRVGLKDGPDWLSTDRYLGTATDGSWGSSSLSGTTSTRTGVTPDGTTIAWNFPVSSWGTLVPPGLRGVNANGTDKFLATKNSALSVVVGTRNPSTRGYIQIGLFKEKTVGDTRSGGYTLFSTNGQRYSLQIDFDAGTYELSDGAAYLSSGRVHVAAQGEALPGTYEFRSPTMAPGLNVARFVATQDALVGAIPVPVPGTALPEPRPFLAARSFVTNQAELSALKSIPASRLVTTGIGAGWPGTFFNINATGALLSECNDMIVFARFMMDLCPVERIISHNITSGGSAGVWHADSGGSAPPFDFQVARIGADLVFLRAGAGIFSIGLDATPTSPAWREVIANGSVYDSGLGLTEYPAYSAFEAISCTPTSCLAMQFAAAQTMLPAFFFASSPTTTPPSVKFTSYPTTTYLLHQGHRLMIRYGGGNTSQHIFIGLIAPF